MAQLELDLKLLHQQVQTHIEISAADIGSKFQAAQKDTDDLTEKVKQEFTKQIKNINQTLEVQTKLYADTMNEIVNIKAQMSQQMSFDPGRDKQRNAGYLPSKSLVPKAFADKAEDWRTWKEDFE